VKDPFAKPEALRLKPIDVDGWPAPIDLVRGRLTLGRATENDVALPAGSFPAVSSRHAEVLERDGKLWARDLGSKNGTLVNGEPVEERALVSGDILRLGPTGPRFMVTGRQNLAHTLFVDARALGLAEHSSRVNGGGASSVAELSKAEIEALVAAGQRRGSRRLLVLSSLLVVSAGLLVREFARSAQQADIVRVLEREEVAQEITAVSEQLERRLAEVWGRLGDTKVAASEPRHVTSASVAPELAPHFATTENEVVEELRREIAETRSELGSTRAELDDVLAKFDGFDPWNASTARLVGVASVRRAVVLIESRLVLRHLKTGALLYEEIDGFTARPNFDGRGEVWTLESTGSGFCIAADGSIITNAHVVSIPNDNQVLLATRGLPIEPVLELRAVFSGETTRHPLTVERYADDGIDVALAQIEPFEGMPFLANFDLDVAPPDAGSDIYLLGFPLGNFVIQEGERVIASTFRGILSRNVGGHMQVDAGVHPGNSGGPITDTLGRVVGIVFSVQAMPDLTALYSIGYGLPIAEVRHVWPRTDAVVPGTADETRPSEREPLAR